MPYYHPKDYYDNTSGRKLADALRDIIQDMGERELDIATGYFDPKIWHALGEALPLLHQFRLLLGQAPELEGQGESQLDLRRYYRQQLQSDVEKLPFNAQYGQMIDGLLAFLEREETAVRLFPTFLHAKAYLFPHIALVGSSNFTQAGLHRTAELNLVRREDAVIKDLRESWFTSFWEQAEDYKPQLIQALQDSKFGTTPYTPFQVFIKALYEYFKERLLPPEANDYGGISLASFQQEGLQEAVRLLEKHRGVLIADAVGLGKTYVGMGLLEQFLLRRRRKGVIPRGLIVCPAQLRDLVWGPKLDEYGLKATICSMEELGRQDFEWQSYNHYDLILVDESHNFRNPNTGRYQSLNKIICTGKANKHVVLMTATPVNNSVWDLYHQLLLLTQGSDKYFQEYNIRSLAQFFKNVEGGSAELFDLLELTTVRRSRHDVKKRQQMGEKIILPGLGEIQFPERELHSLDYNLEQTYSGFYNEIAHQIENLNLVSYNVESFHNQADVNTVKRNGALISLLKMVFLKRLESSLVAFETSVERQEKFQKRFFELFMNGRLLSTHEHRKLLALETDESLSREEYQTAADNILSNLPEVVSADYDVQAIEKHLAEDLKILWELKEWIAIIRGAGKDKILDDKLDQVKKLLNGPLKGQKVLLFTYYHDTARYVYDSLVQETAWSDLATRPVMGLITGSTHNREELVRRFAPAANTSKDEAGAKERQRLKEQEIQLLICTDVLSEGQNLQDAGVLINYDLHWNPVRMIQRAGRIDRLGTLYPNLHIYNCFPEAGLESLLGLVERLRQRIADIDRTVGLDASVLGETIHPRSLDEMRRLKRQDKELMNELERQSELISTDEMKLPLLAYLQMMGEEQIQQLPMGIHSGRKSAAPGTFFAFKARDQHFWRFYPAGGGPVITGIKRIYQLLFCAKDEARLVPPHNIYPLLEQAINEILNELKSYRTSSKIRPKLEGWNKEFYEALNQRHLQGQEVPELLRGRVTQVLQQQALKTFQRDPRLKEIRERYKKEKNVLVLAEQLDAYFVEHELYREVVSPTLLEEIQAEDLQLVCYAVYTAG